MTKKMVFFCHFFVLFLLINIPSKNVMVVNFFGGVEKREDRKS